MKNKFLEKLSSKEGFNKNENGKLNYYDFIRIEKNKIMSDMIIINNLENQDNYLCISHLPNNLNSSIYDLNLEFPDFKYDDETIKNANEGFLFWEDHEFEKAREPLKYAAEKNYLYSMTKYGLLLFNDIIEKQKSLNNFTRLTNDELNTFIYAINLLLKASIRGDETAISFFNNYEIKNIKEEQFDIYINKIGYGPKQVFNLIGGIPYNFIFTNKINLHELLGEISSDNIYKWIIDDNKGFENIKNYPFELKNLLKIYFLNFYYQFFNRLNY